MALYHENVWPEAARLTVELPLYVTGTLASVWFEALAQQMAQNLAQHALAWWKQARRLARASLSCAQQTAWMHQQGFKQRAPLEQVASLSMLKGDASAVFASQYSMFTAAAHNDPQQGQRQGHRWEGHLRQERAELAAALHNHTVRNSLFVLQWPKDNGMTWQDDLLRPISTQDTAAASAGMTSAHAVYAAQQQPQQQPPQQPLQQPQQQQPQSQDASQQQPSGPRRRAAPCTMLVNSQAAQGHGMLRQDPADTRACMFVSALLKQQATELQATQPALECIAARRKMAVAAEWLRAMTTTPSPDDLLGGSTPSSVLLALARLCSSVVGKCMLRRHAVLAVADLLTRQGIVRAKKERLQSQVNAGRLQQCRETDQWTARRPLPPIESPHHRQHQQHSINSTANHRHMQSRTCAKQAATKRRFDALCDARSQLQYINNALQQRRQEVQRGFATDSRRTQLLHSIGSRLYAIKRAIAFADTAEECLLVAGTRLQHLKYFGQMSCLAGAEGDSQGIAHAFGEACACAQHYMLQALDCLDGRCDPLLVIVDRMAAGTQFGNATQLWQECRATNSLDGSLATCSRQARGVWEVIMGNMFGAGIMACMCMDTSAAFSSADRCTPCAYLAPV